MKPAAIGLGTNLGDRFENLLAARRELEKLSATDFFRASRIYESEPLDCPPGSPPFLNAVIVLAFAGTAPELLAALQKIESSLGRARTGLKNEPRPIDLDILTFGEETWNTPELTIPHPRLHLRPFVLRPMTDLTLAPPNDPRLPASVQDLIAEVKLSDQQWPTA